jgi:hypothetical protein
MTSDHLTEELQLKLHCTINAAIYQLDSSNVISTKDKIRLTDMLENLVIDTVTKFACGQKEHGGSLVAKDLVKELDGELIDLMVYWHWIKLQAERNYEIA